MVIHSFLTLIHHHLQAIHNLNKFSQHFFMKYTLVVHKEFATYTWL